MSIFKKLIIRFTTVVVIFLTVCLFSPAVTRLALHAQQVETQTNSVDTLIQQGLSLLQQNRLEEALAKSAAAAALNPNDWRPPALAAYVYSAQQKMKSASESFAAAIRLAPLRKELYLAKAQADYFRNAHDEALAACKKAIEVDPNFAEAYLMIGDLLRFDDQRRAEAISALQTAIRINPKLSDAYNYLGEVFETAHDEKQAEEIFRRGMEADPKRMAGRFTLGRMMVKQGRLAEARQLWDGRTSDEDRTRPQFIEVLTRAENLKRATETLAQKPNDPDALVDMGLAVMDGDHWVVDGRQKRALPYFQRALKINPKFARAQYGIVKAYIQGVDGAKDEKKTVNAELAKLKQLDPKLAAEMETYRKNYVSGIIASPIKIDQ